MSLGDTGLFLEGEVSLPASWPGGVTLPDAAPGGPDLLLSVPVMRPLGEPGIVLEGEVSKPKGWYPRLVLPDDAPDGAGLLLDKPDLRCLLPWAADLRLPVDAPGSADLLAKAAAGDMPFSWPSGLELGGEPFGSGLALSDGYDPCGEPKEPEEPGRDVVVSCQASITGLAGDGLARCGARASAATSITGLRVSGGQTQYLSLTQRPDVAQAAETATMAMSPGGGLVRSIWQDAQRHREEACIQWAGASSVSASTCSSWQQALALPESKAIVFERAVELSQGTCSEYQDGILSHDALCAPFEDAIGLESGTCSGYQDTHNDRGPRLDAPYQEAVPAGDFWCSIEGMGQRLWQAFCQRHEEGQRPPPGISWRYARLLLQPADFAMPKGCAGPKLLLIGPPVGAHLVLLSCILLDDGCGSYLIMNTFSLKTEDGQALDARTFSASIDTDSWCWSWSAEMPATMRALVRPTIDGPVTLIATINGHQVKLLAEGLSQHREFPEAWLTVSGRDHTAWLASPYLQSISREVDDELTAHQVLIYEVLTENGNPIGWDTEWQPADWTIPAFAFTHTGTRIEAACRLAEAAGGFVHGHDTDKTLIVKQLYPALPRDWDNLSPDKVLSEAFCQVEQVDWSEKPSYDCVTVTGGEFGGRSDLIKLTGSAATNPAPSVVDDLMTDSVATIQRGKAVLSDTGRQAMLTIRMPLLAEVGIIKPGAVVDYETAAKTTRGLVRSTRIELEFPEIWQTLEIETREAI